VGFHEPIEVLSLNPLDYGDQVDVIYLHRNASPQDKERALTPLAPYQVSFDADSPDVMTVNGTSVTGVSTTSMVLVRTGVGTPTYTVYTVGDPLAPAYTAGFTPSSNGDWSVNISVAGGTDVATGKSYLVVTPVTTTRDGRISFNSEGSKHWLSVFTNGSIVMDGNFNLAPAVDILMNTDPPPPPWNRVKVLFMAGTDMYMRGSGGAFAEGLVYAHEQFDGRGNVTLKGQLFARNESLVTPGLPNTTNSRVNATGSSLSGSFDLEFNSSVGFFGNYAIVSWRELRDFNPADARP
jgi:hypothetical protein